MSVKPVIDPVVVKMASGELGDDKFDSTNLLSGIEDVVRVFVAK